MLYRHGKTTINIGALRLPDTDETMIALTLRDEMLFKNKHSHKETPESGELRKIGQPLISSIRHFQSQGYNTEEAKEIVASITHIEIAQMLLEESEHTRRQAQLYSTQLGASIADYPDFRRISAASDEVIKDEFICSHCDRGSSTGYLVQSNMGCHARIAIWSVAHKWSMEHPGAPTVTTAKEMPFVRQHRHWALRQLVKSGVIICYRCLVQGKCKVTEKIDTIEIVRDRMEMLELIKELEEQADKQHITQDEIAFAHSLDGVDITISDGTGPAAKEPPKSLHILAELEALIMSGGLEMQESVTPITSSMTMRSRKRSFLRSASCNADFITKSGRVDRHRAATNPEKRTLQPVAADRQIPNLTLDHNKITGQEIAVGGKTFLVHSISLQRTTSKAF